MGLKNTNEDKFILKPNNTSEKIRVDFIFLNISAFGKKKVNVDAVFYCDQDIAAQGNDEAQTKLVQIGTYPLGQCDTHIESSSFARDCHEFAQSVLGEGFEIVGLKEV